MTTTYTCATTETAFRWNYWRDRLTALLEEDYDEFMEASEEATNEALECASVDELLALDENGIICLWELVKKDPVELFHRLGYNDFNRLLDNCTDRNHPLRDIRLELRKENELDFDDVDSNFYTRDDLDTIKKELESWVNGGDYGNTMWFLHDADKYFKSDVCNDFEEWDELWIDLVDQCKVEAFKHDDPEWFATWNGFEEDFIYPFTAVIKNYEQFVKFVEDVYDPQEWIGWAIDSTKDYDADASDIYEWIKKGALEFGEDSDFYDLAEQFCPDFYLEQLLQVSNDDADCA